MLVKCALHLQNDGNTPGQAASLENDLQMLTSENAKLNKEFIETNKEELLAIYEV
jgi:hypothetical protein